MFLDSILYRKNANSTIYITDIIKEGMINDTMFNMINKITNANDSSSTP